ncbi:MAG: hypothetical protein WCT27_04285, partial [Patescibacteria group bacterium]
SSFWVPYYFSLAATLESGRKKGEKPPYELIEESCKGTDSTIFFNPTSLSVPFSSEYLLM